jgi:SagB-type dehydrogenase family enzyme
LRRPATRRGRGTESTVSARLAGRVTLQAQAGGEIIACFDGDAVHLGVLSATAADRAQKLRTGLPLASFASGRRSVDREIGLLVRRLAGHGLLEYRLGQTPTDSEVVIEPQVAGYWPRAQRLGNADVLTLSRFAFMRRRGNEMVLESPRADASFRICNPKIATAIAVLSTPQRITEFRRQEGFPGLELLGLLVDNRILFKPHGTRDRDQHESEGDDDLALWDFHDLLFHTRSTEGRHANPLGGLYPHAGAIPPLPAVRPRWPGRRIDLRKFSAASAPATSPVAKVLHERYSTRSFNDLRPITLAELARLLDSTARVRSRWSHREHLGNASPVMTYAPRPYPSAGASYELEIYVAVARCEGLARGFYHYDAGAHALVPIATRAYELQSLLTGAAFAMDAPAAPQILITIVARFGRVSWKYSALAYALILKDVGVLTQTLYLMATDMGLGGCAIGSFNIDLFARMTGIAFHVEGPV